MSSIGVKSNLMPAIGIPCTARGDIRRVQVAVAGDKGKFLRPRRIRHVRLVKNRSFRNFEWTPPQVRSCVKYAGSGISVLPLATLSQHLRDGVGAGGKEDWLPLTPLPLQSSQSLQRQRRNDLSQMHEGSSLSLHAYYIQPASWTRRSLWHHHPYLQQSGQ